MTLSVGWIGCGRHARQMLLPHLSRTGMRLAAVCDVDRHAAETVAADYGVPEVAFRVEDLLAHRHLDAVCMAVGPDVHLSAGLAALERGLPVFMEKPPAPDHAGALRLAEASEATGLPVVVGFMKRYSTGNRIARNVIARDFDPVLGLTASYMTAPTYFEGAADYTGFFLHHCVHAMDLAPWLVGAAVTDMTVRSVEPAPGRLLFHLGLTFANGAVGTVVMGTVQSRGTPMERIEVMGDHRRVTVTNVVDVAYHRDPPFKADDPAATLADAADTLVWTPNFTAAANEDHKGYAALLAAAARTFRGEPSDAPTIADGVAAMALLDRLRGMIASAR